MCGDISWLGVSLLRNGVPGLGRELSLDWLTTFGCIGLAGGFMSLGGAFGTGSVDEDARGGDFTFAPFPPLFGTLSFVGVAFRFGRLLIRSNDVIAP